MAGTIVVNDQPMRWREGMTVSDVLRERNYIFPLVIVTIDGRNVPRAEFPSTTVPDGSAVVVVHLMSGG